MKLKDLIPEWHPLVGQLRHKPNKVDESTVSIDDLDIKTHGKRNTLTVPTETELSGFYDNPPGNKGLEDWKRLMKTKYGVKQVEVKDGKVIVKSPKLDATRKKYISGKADTLRSWGTTE